ncbi:tetratricopeptide repeat protein [Catenulispora yoronensis]
MVDKAVDRAVDEVVALCGHLPLAIRIVAARLVHRPAWTIDDLRRRLAGGVPLGALDDGRVASAFDLSYRQLIVGEQRLLRWLSVHPGPDLDVRLAGALLGTSAESAEAMLEELLDVHLLQQYVAGRYRLHDLVRGYAAVQLASAGEDRDGIWRLAWGHFTGTAAAAMDALYPHESAHRPAVEAMRPTVALADPRAWLDAERDNLLALLADAEARRAPVFSGQLAATWAFHLIATGRYHDSLVVYGYALRAARESGDDVSEGRALSGLGAAYGRLHRLPEAMEHHQRHLDIAVRTGDLGAEARAHNSLGITHFRLGDYPAALGHHRRSLELARKTGDRAGEGRALNNLGLVLQMTGGYAEALEHTLRALEIHREAGNRIGEANALTNAGSNCERLGRYTEALSYHELALAIARERGNHHSEAISIGNMGIAHHRLGQHDEAIRCFTLALDMALSAGELGLQASVMSSYAELLHDLGRGSEARELYEQAERMAVDGGDRLQQARAIDGRGAVHLAAGDRRRAVELWREALAIYGEIGAPEASDVRAALDGVGWGAGDGEDEGDTSSSDPG